MRIAAVLCLIPLAACQTESTSSAATPVVGIWTTAPAPVNPAGTLQYRLTFSGPGSRFIADARFFGGYAGQGPGDVTSYSTLSGRYRVSGNRLVFSPEVIETFDAMSQPQPVRKSFLGNGFMDNATFERVGSELRLTFVTYPADAPVTTHQTYTLTGIAN